MEFLEVPLFDDDLFKLLTRFGMNAVFLTLMVKFAIYPNQKDREFGFTVVMMNVTVFFICFTLKKLDLGIGMALGLFAIFGVLRYRTDAIRAKEMTYLFIVVGIAVVNSLSNKKTSYAELAAVNMMILIAAAWKERYLTKFQKAEEQAVAEAEAEADKSKKCSIEYDKLERLSPELRDELLADLKQRTGLDIVRVQIKSIQVAQSVATLNVWYNEEPDSESEQP